MKAILEREYDTLGLYQNGIPVACVSVDVKFNILEIKVPFNQKVSPLIEEIVQKELNKQKNKA